MKFHLPRLQGKVQVREVYGHCGDDYGADGGGGVDEAEGQGKGKGKVTEHHFREGSVAR